jgi:probable HAF family extracellular repeat protein
LTLSVESKEKCPVEYCLRPCENIFFYLCAFARGYNKSVAVTDKMLHSMTNLLPQDLVLREHYEASLIKERGKLMGHKNRTVCCKMVVSLLSVVLCVVICGCDARPLYQKPELTILPEIYAGGQTIPVDISTNGQVIVGSSATAGAGQQQAFRWTKAEGLVAMGFLPGKDVSTAVATNSDGSIIIGNAINPEDGSVQGWIWTAKTDMQAIPLPDEATDCEAVDVSDDGTVIGRYAFVQDDGLVWQAPFLWSQANGFGDYPLDGWGGTTNLITENPIAIAADGFSVVFNRFVMPDSSSTAPEGAWIVQFGLPFGDGQWVQYAVTPQDAPVFEPARGAYISDPVMLGGTSGMKDSGALTWAIPAIWTAESGIQQLAAPVIGRTCCISADGVWAGGGNMDAGSAFVWNAESGFQFLMIFVQQMDLALGSTIADQFTDEGFPSDVYGIAKMRGSNKNRLRMTGTIGTSAFGNPCRGFILDVPHHTGAW